MKIKHSIILLWNFQSIALNNSINSVFDLRQDSFITILSRSLTMGFYKFLHSLYNKLLHVTKLISGANNNVTIKYLVLRYTNVMYLQKVHYTGQWSDYKTWTIKYLKYYKNKYFQPIQSFPLIKYIRPGK